MENPFEIVVKKVEMLFVPSSGIAENQRSDTMYWIDADSFPMKFYERRSYASPKSSHSL
jgi:hypothetical protein